MISSKNIKKELIWYYYQSSADLGISSNFGTIISQGCGFSHSGNYYEDKILAIASQTKSPFKKLRKIEHALAHMPKQDRRVLDALYGDYNYPPQLVSVFGEKTGAAIFNKQITHLPYLLTLCSKKLAKAKLTEIESNALNLIHQEAETIFNRVHNSYWESRNATDAE